MVLSTWKLEKRDTLILTNTILTTLTLPKEEVPGWVPRRTAACPVLRGRGSWGLEGTADCSCIGEVERCISGSQYNPVHLGGMCDAIHHTDCISRSFRLSTQPCVSVLVGRATRFGRHPKTRALTPRHDRGTKPHLEEAPRVDVVCRGQRDAVDVPV